MTTVEEWSRTEMGTEAVFDAPVHPVAALFPMMTDEELDDLGADIKANGQVHPIVLDQHGTLLDGRNRREACRRAGVAPDVISETLDDPVAFILSVNVARRHMNKGQTAMAVAKAKSFFKNDLAWGEQTDAAGVLGVSRARMAYAVGVMRHAPELADRVLADDLSLNDAYAAAIQSKRARLTAEQEAAQHDADMAKLREGAPDLAERVEDHRLDTKEALAQLARREAEEQERRQTTTRLLIQTLAVLDPGQVRPEARARDLWSGRDAALLSQSGAMGELSIARLKACRAVVDNLIGFAEKE